MQAGLFRIICEFSVYGCLSTWHCKPGLSFFEKAKHFICNSKSSFLQSNLRMHRHMLVMRISAFVAHACSGHHIALVVPSFIHKPWSHSICLMPRKAFHPLISSSSLLANQPQALHRVLQSVSTRIHYWLLIAHHSCKSNGRHDMALTSHFDHPWNFLAVSQICFNTHLQMLHHRVQVYC